VRDSQFRTALVVAGTAAQVEGALAAPIGRFTRGGQTYHAPLADPSLPESIAASVRGIVGLDDLPKFRPLATLPGGETALVPGDDVISLSFGLCEQAAPGITLELFDAFYALANAQGQTVLVASGDDGGRDCAPQSLALAVNGLASSPHVVSVGGTSFALASDGSVPPPASLV